MVGQIFCFRSPKGNVGSSCALGPADGPINLLYLIDPRGGGRKDSGRAGAILPSQAKPEAKSDGGEDRVIKSFIS